MGGDYHCSECGFETWNLGCFIDHQSRTGHTKETLELEAREVFSRQNGATQGDWDAAVGVARFERLIRYVWDSRSEDEKEYVLLGGVEFWFDTEGHWQGQLSFNIPMERWDLPKLRSALAVRLALLNGGAKECRIGTIAHKNT